MKYAVIAISGTQYKVSENETITIDHIEAKEGDVLSTDQVLLIADDKDVKIGQPTISNATVQYQVVKNYQGKKIDVTTFKAKSRYRRHIGFRAQLTDVKILKISL